MSITKFRNSLRSGPFLKIIYFGIALVFLAGCFTFYGSYIGPNAEQRGGGGYAVKVNGETISSEQFYTNVQDWDDRLKQQNVNATASETAGFKSQLINQMITATIMRQEAKRRDIKVRGREINESIDKSVEDQMSAFREAITKKLTRGKKKPTSDEVEREMEVYIRMDTRNPEATISSFEKEIRGKISRDDVETTLVMRKLEESVGRSARVSDRELIDGFRQVKARHILLNTTLRPEDQARRKADEIVKALKSGGDFDALARKWSDDTSTAKKGGEYPTPITKMYAEAQGVDSDVAKAMFALRPGQVSDVIRAKDGFEIVKVDSEATGLPPDFEAKKKEFLDQARQTRRGQAMNDLYDKLRKDAKIEVAEGELRGYWLQNQARQSPQNYKTLFEKAAREFEKQLERFPGDGAAVYTLARVYMVLGSTDKALRLLELKLENPDTANVEGQDLRLLLGDLYAAKKDIKRALVQYDLASQIGIGDESTHTQLVERYKQLGQKQLAAKEQEFVDRANAERAARQGGAAPAQPASP